MGALAGGGHVGRRGVVLVVGHQDGAGVDPDARNAMVGECGRDHPAAHQLADGVDGVARARRHLAQHRERVHQADQLLKFESHVGEQARAALAGYRRRHGEMPLLERLQRRGRRTLRFAVFRQLRDRDECVGHAGKRRDDDDGRVAAGVFAC